jgi:hypothetical protein
MSRSTISTFQLFALFPTEDSARVYLEKRLWPNGPVCPDCKSGERVSPLGVCATRKPGFYRCGKCGDFTWRTGTIFERGHLSALKVCAALLLIAEQPEITSASLAEQVGVQQKTAYLLLCDVRVAAQKYFDALIATDATGFARIARWPAYRFGADGSVWTRWRVSRKPQLGFSWRELKPHANWKRGGYRTVALSDGRVSSRQRVCRLVCEAFHGACPDGMECNHRDGVSTNDAEDNLFWGPHLDNMAIAKLSGAPKPNARGERNHKAKITDSQLAEIIALRGTTQRRFIAERFGVSPTRVSQIWKQSRLTA